tara:strand:- start:306 stop:602 length:297 start_codon:yes stop_codon:yes gene_type:complete
MIQISKPLTGGTGSVTTGEWESGNSYATSSQASAIKDVLEALETNNIISSFVEDDTLDDTTKMSNRTMYTILTARKEAVDHVIDVLNLLDNKKVMPSS